MTIDEATKRLKSYLNARNPAHYGDFEDSIKLGIEALKQIKREREKGVGFWADRLPGETEEVK